MKKKRILMVAYHFPPLAGSSGIQRTLRFAQHLPALGWEPLVLSADPRAYERTADDLLREVPEGMVVRRAFALDTARHLTLKGRYLGAMARPDRWISWRFDGVRQGLRLIREYQPDLIWSTYPIATAHVIGARLHRESGIPWVADFRDPMAQDGYPADPKTWKAFQAIEAEAAQQARWCVFTTPGAAQDYRARYPQAAARTVVIENGYDEESFTGAPAAAQAAPGKRPWVLLHSGIVYPSERDPTQLFIALARLQREGLLAPEELRIRFRSAVHDELLRGLAAAHGVTDFIELCPPIGYREALAEMLGADGLLVMQASNCNAQIPAKIYEYLRAGRPILALTDPAGDTAGVLRTAALPDVVPLDSAEAIAAALLRLLAQLRAGQVTLPDPAAVRQASRRGRAEQLVELLRST